jgi:hypothetical protein
MQLGIVFIFFSSFDGFVIPFLASSSAPTGLTSFALILWGLRGTEEGSGKRIPLLLTPRRLQSCWPRRRKPTQSIDMIS